MSALKDITGQRFGRLVAIERVGSNTKGKALWRFACDCGNTHIAAGVDVRCSGTHCCGCLIGGRTHGLKGTRIYRIWSSMRARCGHICKGVPNYAGRGIRVCDEWQKLEAFNAWAQANGYDDTKQIDRINNDRVVGYSQNFRNRTGMIDEMNQSLWIDSFDSFPGQFVAGIIQLVVTMQPSRHRLIVGLKVGDSGWTVDATTKSN